MNARGEELIDPVEPPGDFDCRVDSDDYILRIEPVPGTIELTYIAVHEVLQAVDDFNDEWRIDDWVPSFDIQIEYDDEVTATGSLESLQR